MRFSVVAAAAPLLFFPLASRADLTGDTIHVTFNYPQSSTVYEDDGNVVAGVPGSDATSSLGQFTVTVLGSQIVITDTNSSGFLQAAFNGFVFTDLTTDPMITGVMASSASTLTGGVPTFTSNSVALNFEGQPAAVNEDAIFNLSFAPQSVTPEPSSLALLSTGFLGVAGVVRRRFVRS